MIASFAMMLFGTTMKLPALVRSRSPGYLGDPASNLAHANPVTTLNGRSLWGEPGNAFLRVSCRAKPTTTAPTADGRAAVPWKTKVATTRRTAMTIAS